MMGREQENVHTTFGFLYVYAAVSQLHVLLLACLFNRPLIWFVAIIELQLCHIIIAIHRTIL